MCEKKSLVVSKMTLQFVHHLNYREDPLPDGDAFL